MSFSWVHPTASAGKHVCFIFRWLMVSKLKRMLQSNNLGRYRHKPTARCNSYTLIILLGRFPDLTTIFHEVDCDQKLFAEAHDLRDRHDPSTPTWGGIHGVSRNLDHLPDRKNITKKRAVEPKKRYIHVSPVQGDNLRFEKKREDFFFGKTPAMGWQAFPPWNT